jgi:2Fe-2S ferredoxin
MAKITYIEFNGTEYVLDVKPGMSLMEGALHNDVPGLDALCGGACACGTCHVYVDEAWLDKVGTRSAKEDDMLICSEYMKANSRLACEIGVSDALDGLIVRIPESQG